MLRSSGYSSVHNHPNSFRSGVFYVPRGGPEPTPPENGKLELLGPRSGVNMLYLDGNVLDGRYIVDPVPGLMVVFPSWLRHMVRPYFGTGERISVAFNVIIEERCGEVEGGSPATR